MRPPWRSRPRRGFPAAPSWPSLSPQRGGCLRKPPACGILFFVWWGFAWGLPGGKSTVLLREYSARQSPGSFSLSVQAVGLRGSRQPLNNPGVRQPPLYLRHSLRPDGPSGCAVPGAAVLVAASVPRRPGLRSLLSAADASGKPPPVGFCSLFGGVLLGGFFFNEFALKAGAYFACLRVFTVLLRADSARQAVGSFSLSRQAVGLRGLRQPLNNPGVRQPPLFLRHSLRPDGPSGCAIPGAAVLVAASVPRRPGLRSLLSAADASGNPPPVGFCSFFGAALPGACQVISPRFCSENVPSARREGVSACLCRRSG